MKKDFDFSGYVTKYNVVCSDGRTIAPKAFKGCDGKVVPLRDTNCLDGNVIGTIILQHRSDGVYGYGQFNDSPLARAYKRLVEGHAMDNLGIFATIRKEEDKIVTSGVIRSVSICYHGSNPEAYIDSVTGQEKGGKCMKKIRISRTKLTAHWIDISDTTTDDGGRDWHIREYKCDNCGFYARAYGTAALFFCNGCGARMVKKNETN